jgi:hypothetical protein
MVRTGIVAMRRGSKSSTAPSAEELDEVTAETNDDEGQSV